MKFIAITSALFAALACAQPVVELTEPVGLEEAAPQLVGAAEKRALAKRANVQFYLYTTSGKFLISSSNCKISNDRHQIARGVIQSSLRPPAEARATSMGPSTALKYPCLITPS